MYYNQEIKINHLVCQNRIVMPPMATTKTIDGYVTQDMIDYYDQRVDKLGLVIVEHGYIRPDGISTHAMISYAEDDKIPGLKRLVDAIHSHNVPVVAQINHCGARAGIEPLKSSSDGMEKGKPFYALSKSEILEIEDSFVQATLRAKEAGFDGVEIHSAHGYLLNQFYSPVYNKREDEYGKNRILFHLETIQKIREAVGKDYPLLIRLGAKDYCEGGSTIEDAIQASIAFEKAGIDCIDITGGTTGFVNPADSNPGYFKEISIEVKKHVSVPVILTGGVHTVEQADELIESKCGDLIGVGREIYKNSNWSKSI